MHRKSMLSAIPRCYFSEVKLRWIHFFIQSTQIAATWRHLMLRCRGICWFWPPSNYLDSHYHSLFVKYFLVDLHLSQTLSTLRCKAQHCGAALLGQVNYLSLKKVPWLSKNHRKKIRWRFCCHTHAVYSVMLGAAQNATVTCKSPPV